LNVHGTSDPLVPWNGGGLAKIMGVDFPAVMDNMNAWAARMGCASSTRTTFT